MIVAMLLQKNFFLLSLVQSHQHFMQTIFHTKVLQAAFFYLHVAREKLPKRLLYKKVACKMLMKLNQGQQKIIICLKKHGHYHMYFF